ncbi:hypothetical protein JNL27_18160, partial [bacterium]|nr:hypothetical protein [bacterium]
NVPQWWLVLSGVFFGAFILLLVALVVMCVMLMTTLRETTQQVRRLADRADEIGQRVESLASGVQTTQRALSGHAQNVAGSVEAIARGIAQKADIIATGFMIFQTIQRLRKR